MTNLHSILHALFDLARNGVPATSATLAARCGLRRPQVDDALARLDRLGLVDAGRCRLTLAGLAVASSGRAGAILCRAA